MDFTTLVLHRLQRAITSGNPIMFDADEAFILNEYIQRLIMQNKALDAEAQEMRNEMLQQAQGTASKLLALSLKLGENTPIVATESRE